MADLTAQDLIVTADDLIEWGNLGDLTVGQRQAASAILVDLQGELEDHLGRNFKVRAETETHRLGKTYRGRLFFRKGPVVSIDSIEFNGSPLSADHYAVRDWGIDQIRVGPIGATTDPPEIVVTYQAGYADGEVPRGIRTALKRKGLAVVAQVVLDRLPGVASISSEGESVKYQAGETWSPDELKAVSRYRRRRAG